MSILQEYESIRENMGEEKFHCIEVYLSLHPELYLSDIYYNQEASKRFEVWNKERCQIPNDEVMINVYALVGETCVNGVPVCFIPFDEFWDSVKKGFIEESDYVLIEIDKDCKVVQ